MENAVVLSQLIYRLGIVAVLTIEKAHGDRKAGADKKTLALDWLHGVAAGAMAVLPGDKAVLAQQVATDASDAIEAGYDAAKGSGLYAAATATATVANGQAKPAAVEPHA